MCWNFKSHLCALLEKSIFCFKMIQSDYVSLNWSNGQAPQNLLPNCLLDDS